MKKIFIIGILLLTFICPTFAQFDSIVNKFQKEFDSFRQDIEQKHRQFTNKNDSVFARFLKDSWEEFDVFYNEIQEPSKPVIQPEIKETEKPILREIKPAPNDSNESHHMPHGKTESIPGNKTVEPSEKSGRAIIDINFYGTNAAAAHPGNLPNIKCINAENIESYFQETCNLSSVSELVQELQLTKKKMHLNDWGYYRLTEQTAGKIEETDYKQTLLAWIILLKSGYNVKVGFTDNNIFLMFPSYEEIFSIYYLTIDGTAYYIQTNRGKDEPLPRLQVHKANYPGNNNISMHLSEIPLIGNDIESRRLHFRGDTIQINQNKWLINFYKEYPHCELGVYFSAPLSGEVIQALENNFNPYFNKSTNREKVEMLLNFVQNAFTYKPDGDQFGHEKYFFPDEIFYYPCSDCEDRSILFTWLVKHFTEYDCVGLDYPGHVNTAVNFNEEINGTYINLEDKKYIVCDPTYVNAPIGYLDLKYTKWQPKIILSE